ncbi:MAG: preprotein translocase subunit YajC [Bacteroidales bacterium]|nr:preprotein translocase subunit YajC [Bacteroidales bacterium]
MFTTLLQAVQEPGQGNMLMSFLPFIIVIAIMYFLMIRPQQQRQKKLNEFRDSLKKGDQVMTTGGIYGKISEVKEDVIVVEVAEGVKMRFDKSAILSATDKNLQQ